jgi:outer membrane protein OmpU
MNIKKIGLTALAASLVSVSAQAGAISVAGSASMNTSGVTGDGQNGGTSFSMGNQLTFTGSGELDNGLTVSLSYVQDEGTATFDNHHVQVSSDSLGTLKLVGQGGSTASNQVDKTAAGDLWDKFDGLGTIGTGNNVTVNFGTDLAQTASAGTNAFLYTSPELIEGLTLVGSYQPQASNRESGTGIGINYSGVDGLTLNYAVTDVVGTDNDSSGDNTVMKASYVYGSVTATYSHLDHDENLSTHANDMESSSWAVSYTITDELSVTYGTETHDKGNNTVDSEIDGVSFSYTAGGMTISGSMTDGQNLDNSNTVGADVEKWTLGASFAF